MNFIRNRSASLSMVVLVMFLVGFFQGSISYSISLGRLDNLLPSMSGGLLPALAFVVRGALLLIVFILWILNRKQQLFKAIIVTTSVFTLGLFLNMITLLEILRGLVDPPGVDGKVRDNEPWDFLFPQRAQSISNYENWIPRYTDYIYLACTTSFAFRPTDALLLTRRAKLLMLLQASISIITLTAIASSAINIMVGGN